MNSESRSGQGCPQTIDSDPALSHAVNEALAHDPLVPAQFVHVASAGSGWVTLEGEVDYLTQKCDAEIAARNVEDVLGVINQITVKPGTFESVEPEPV